MRTSLLDNKPFKLYIITTSELWPVKIGISKYPKVRLREFQIAHWLELRIYALFEIEYKSAQIFEAKVHRELASHSIRGEWFGLTASKAERLLLEIMVGITEKQSNLLT